MPIQKVNLAQTFRPKSPRNFRRLGRHLALFKPVVKADAVNPVASGITARYAYDGFGKEVSVSGADADKNAFRFSTKQLDVETGMNYYGYRYYAADAGRWINRDPILEFGGNNIYAMVNNNANCCFDILGLACVANGAPTATPWVMEEILITRKVMTTPPPPVPWPIKNMYPVYYHVDGVDFIYTRTVTQKCKRDCFWSLPLWCFDQSKVETVTHSASFSTGVPDIKQGGVWTTTNYMSDLVNARAAEVPPSAAITAPPICK